MMLLNSFYSLKRSDNQSDGVRAVISFVRSHPIFDGHFPGHPVVPGVCMMQIIREVLEKATGQKLSIAKGDNMKFLAIINPDEHSEVEVVIDYTSEAKTFPVTASIQAGSTTFFKFKGLLQHL